MFELNMFNAAQVVDQIFDFVAMYLLTSLSAKVRFYGFSISLIGLLPAVYLLIVTELYCLLTCMPVWLLIESRGVLNNWREYKTVESDYGRSQKGA